MAAKKSAKTAARSTKKVPAKRSASKVSARKSTAKKVVSKKAVTKKPATKKAAAKKPPAKKTTSKKVTAKKAAGKMSSAKKAAAKKPSAKKASAKKSPAKKAAAGKTTKAGKKSPVKKTAAITASKKPTTQKPARSRESVLSGPIHGVHPYSPKRGEAYMGEAQREHFRTILTNWKQELMEEVDRTVHHMQDEAANFPDPNDRATQESEFGLELRTRDRERKLLKKIDSALKRLEEGSYGYCEETGEEIGLKRLEARPVATLCLEAQERRELAERQFRDRDDRYR